MEIKELEEDIQELKQLLCQSKRSSNQNCIQNEIQKIQQIIIELQKKEAEVQKKAEQQKQTLDNQEQKNVNYQQISNYSFDQEGKKIKVYLFLDNVGDVKKEDIKSQFQKQSIDLLIHNYNGKNLQFKIPRLQEKIVSENSKLIQKQNRITLILEKASSSHWNQLAYKENLLKDDKNEKLDDKDPQAGLMNLMKQMYESGDDEMKRTITKAWSESQEKQKNGQI